MKMNKKNENHFIIPGLGPLGGKSFKKIKILLEIGGSCDLVNIICPGYKKSREKGAEEFDFSFLSESIDECPNVQLMIEKMLHTAKNLRNQFPKAQINLVMILADVAILNYSHLSSNQNVKFTLNKFYQSIKVQYKTDKNIEFVKMSQLPAEFKRIPISGVKLNKNQLNFLGVEPDIRKRALEYMGSLIFQRVNIAMTNGVYKQIDIQKYIDIARKDTARFVVEYGIAGKAISKLYNNPIILFTEPSGYLRGYFYNSYFKKDVRTPILYTV